MILHNCMLCVHNGDDHSWTYLLTPAILICGSIVVRRGRNSPRTLIRLFRSTIEKMLVIRNREGVNLLTLILIN